MRRAVNLLGGLVVTCAILACANCDRDTGEVKVRGVVVLAEAAGATRLLVAENGRYVAAELAGAWVDDVFPYETEPDEVPPVLKVIDLETRRVIATVNGWAIGAPAADGAQLYLGEVGEEYAYQVRSTANPQMRIELTPPSLGWIPRATLRMAGDLSVVMLRAPGKPGTSERLWLAAIDAAQARVMSSTTIDSATPFAKLRAYDVAVAVNPKTSMIYIGENAHPADPWMIRAFSVPDFRPVWNVELPEDPDVSHAAAAFGVSGTGEHVFVAHGSGSAEHPELRAVHVVAADSGAIVESVNAFDARLETSKVVSIVPVMGRDEVAVLSLLRYRVGGGETPDQRVESIWRFDLDARTASTVFELSASLGKQAEAWRSMKTASIATLPDGKILLAPPDVTWINKWLGGKLPDGNGLDRGEIRGLVEHPDWHQRGRPRFDARQSALQTAEENDEDAPVVDAGVPPG